MNEENKHKLEQLPENQPEAQDAELDEELGQASFAHRLLLLPLL